MSRIENVIWKNSMRETFKIAGTIEAIRRTPGMIRNIGFLILAFVVLRLGSYIPLPGVDAQVWADTFNRFQGPFF